jgi:chemotaxis protein MotB
MAIEEDPPAGVPDWIVSFGDMMSLLLCFFVLLFSMGTTEQQKFQAMAEAMQERFGDPNPKLKLYPRTHPPLRSRKERHGPESWDDGQQFQTSKTETNLEADERHRMWIERAGQVPTLGTVLEFRGDESDLTVDHLQQLAKVTSLFAGKANLIAIRGHADSSTSRRFGDDHRQAAPFDLAYARCRAVSDYLAEQASLDARRFRLEVAGDSEPLYRGADPQQRKRNSRVELYLLNDLLDSRPVAR